jgi:hypothetical protein
MATSGEVRCGERRGLIFQQFFVASFVGFSEHWRARPDAGARLWHYAEAKPLRHYTPRPLTGTLPTGARQI